MKLKVALWLILWLCLPAIAWATDAAVTIRCGNHPGFGRIVFDLPPGSAPEVAIAGRVLTVRIGAAVRWASIPRPPRNVLGIKTEGTLARITFASDIPPRRTREPNKLIFDFADPPPPAHHHRRKRARATMPSPRCPTPPRRRARARSSNRSPRPCRMRWR